MNSGREQNHKSQEWTLSCPIKPLPGRRLEIKEMQDFGKTDPIMLLFLFGLAFLTLSPELLDSSPFEGVGWSEANLRLLQFPQGIGGLPRI